MSNLRMFPVEAWKLGHAIKIFLCSTAILLCHDFWSCIKPIYGRVHKALSILSRERERERARYIYICYVCKCTVLPSISLYWIMSLNLIYHTVSLSLYFLIILRSDFCLKDSLFVNQDFNFFILNLFNIISHRLNEVSFQLSIDNSTLIQLLFTYDGNAEFTVFSGILIAWKYILFFYFKNNFKL